MATMQFYVQVSTISFLSLGETEAFNCGGKKGGYVNVIINGRTGLLLFCEVQNNQWVTGRQNMLEALWNSVLRMPFLSPQGALKNKEIILVSMPLCVSVNIFSLFQSLKQLRFTTMLFRRFNLNLIL